MDGQTIPEDRLQRGKAMSELKTVEDVIERLDSNLLSNKYTGSEEDKCIFKILANEIKGTLTLCKEIKEILKRLEKKEIENRLLIEHEETVRTTKAKPISGGKNTKLKLKRGDIVCRIKDITTHGLVEKVNGDRALVIFNDKASWVDIRSLQYYIPKQYSIR